MFICHRTTSGKVVGLSEEWLYNLGVQVTTSHRLPEKVGGDKTGEKSYVKKKAKYAINVQHLSQMYSCYSTLGSLHSSYKISRA